MTRDRESLNVDAAAYLAREHGTEPEPDRPAPGEYRDDPFAMIATGICSICGARRDGGPDAACFFADDERRPSWCDHAERLAAA